MNDTSKSVIAAVPGFLIFWGVTIFSARNFDIHPALKLFVSPVCGAIAASIWVVFIIVIFTASENNNK